MNKSSKSQFFQMILLSIWILPLFFSLRPQVNWAQGTQASQTKKTKKGVKRFFYEIVEDSEPSADELAAKKLMTYFNDSTENFLAALTSTGPNSLGVPNEMGMTPLMLAIKQQKKEIILPILNKMLPQHLAQQANFFTIPDFESQQASHSIRDAEMNQASALMLAILEYSSWEIIDAIIGKMPPEQWAAANYRGRTSLMLAAIYRLELLEHLLGKIPEEQLPEQLGHQDSVFIFEKILPESQLKKEKTYKRQGKSTVLMYLIEKKAPVEKIQLVLNAMDSDQIEKQTRAGESALSIAFKFKPEIVPLIIKKSRSVNISNFKIDEMPLISYLVKNNLDMLEQLLPNFKKEDFSLVTEKGDTVLIEIIKNRPSLVEKILPILDHEQIIQKSKKTGSTPIMYAVQENNVAFFPLLEKYTSKDLGIVNNLEKTVLFYLSGDNDEKAAAILQKMRKEDITKRNFNMSIVLEIITKQPKTLALFLPYFSDDDLARFDLTGDSPFMTAANNSAKSLEMFIPRINRKRLNLKSAIDGKTALMILIAANELDSDEVKADTIRLMFSKMRPEDILIEDHKGKNALYYAVSKPPLFGLLFSYLHNDLFRNLDKDPVATAQRFFDLVFAYAIEADIKSPAILNGLYQSAIEEFLVHSYGDDFPPQDLVDYISLFAASKNIPLSLKSKEKMRLIQERDIVVPLLEKFLRSKLNPPEVSIDPSCGSEIEKIEKIEEIAETVPCLSCGQLDTPLLSTCKTNTLCTDCSELYASEVKGGQFSALEYLCPKEMLPTPMDYYLLQEKMQLSDLDLHKLQKYELSRRLGKIPNFKFCKGQDCFNGMLWVPGHGTGFHCVLCEKLLCVLCGHEHSGKSEKECDEYKKGDVSFQKMLHDPRSELHPCPHCLTATLKKEACDHMNCEFCKEKWDWKLGKTWGPVHYSKTDGSEPRTYRVPGDLKNGKTGEKYTEYTEGVTEVEKDEGENAPGTDEVEMDTGSNAVPVPVALPAVGIAPQLAPINLAPDEDISQDFYNARDHD